MAGGTLAPKPDGAPFTAVVGAILAWAVLLVLITWAVGLLPLLVRRVSTAGSTTPVPQPASSAASWHRVRTALMVVSVFILLTALASRTPRLAFFTQFENNWQGKLVDLLWVSILFAMLWRWARDEARLTWRIRPGSGRWALIVIGAVFGVFVGLTLLAVATDPEIHETVDADQLLYNTTIPNLTEELIWRAAMLAVLDRAYGTPWRLAGAPVGWPGGHQRDIRGCAPDPAQSEWGVLTEHRWWNLRRRDGCGDGVDLGLYPQRVASLPLALRAGSRSGRRDDDRRLTRGQAGGTPVTPAIALPTLAKTL